jgi:hypothetical protein
MKATKIYLGSRFDRHLELETYANVLKGWGHEITSRWHSLNAETRMRDGDPEVGFNQGIAFADQAGIFVCELFVAFSEDPFNPPKGSARGGRHVELGLALGYGKLCFVVGPRENVFHYLPEVKNFSTAKEWLVYMASPTAEEVFEDIAQIRVKDSNPEIFRAKGFSRP